MRAAQRILVSCLICLPTVAFADVYTLSPPPDLGIDITSITTASGSMQNVSFTGTVESITDQLFGGCSSGCFVGLDFTQSGGSFSVTSVPVQGVATTTYLAGTLIDSTIEIGSGTNTPDGEVGELFDVTYDNTPGWTSLENEWATSPVAQASSFGSTVVIDLHQFDPATSGSSSAVADMTPAVPEPASLTLLLTGLAAGFARRRMTGKKS